MSTGLGVDEAGVSAAVTAARATATGKRPALELPDPRFKPAVDANTEDGEKADRKVRRASDETTTTVRDQKDKDRSGVAKVVGTKSSTDSTSSRTGDVPKTLSPAQQQSRASFLDQIKQMMTPQAQQQGTNAFNQMAPAMQQAMGPASSMGQYPPGTIQVSRSQLAALLAAVDGADTSTTSEGSKAPGVSQFGEVSNKGALSVDEVALSKTGSGVLSKEELDNVIVKACEANGITDPQAQARWLDTMRNVTEHESGRDPDAGNGWDSNAVGATMGDGLPAKSSRGLAQCIPSTFAAYHVQGTSTNIYDPTASVAASINYISHRYGGGVKDGTTLGEFNAARTGGYVGY